jgi:predicted RNA binding protein YcfA (HicA-like mRNA interferase family)
MKTGELLRLFAANGVRFVKHRARHDMYHSPLTDAVLYVPRHAKEIPVGTAQAILKKAGIGPNR